MVVSAYACTVLFMIGTVGYEDLTGWVADLASSASTFATHGQCEGSTSVLQRSGQSDAGHADIIARCAGKATIAVRTELLGHAADLIESARAMSTGAFVSAGDGHQRLPQPPPVGCGTSTISGRGC